MIPERRGQRHGPEQPLGPFGPDIAPQQPKQPRANGKDDKPFDRDAQEKELVGDRRIRTATLHIGPNQPSQCGDRKDIAIGHTKGHIAKIGRAPGRGLPREPKAPRQGCKTHQCSGEPDHFGCLSRGLDRIDIISAVRFRRI